LVLLIGPTTYGFSFVVSAVIAGIAMGSAVSSRWTARSRRPASLLAVVQIVAALSSLAGIQIIGRLPVPVGQLIRANADRMSWLLQVELFWVFLLLIVPSFLFGAAFPLAVRLLYQSVRETGKATGRIYAWNTVGAVAGSLLAGFCFLPWIGMEATLYFAAIVHVIAGSLVVVAASRKTLRLAWAAAAIGASVFAPFVLPGWDRELLSGGMYKYAAYLGEGEVLDFLRRGDLIFYREDEVTTVSVKQVGSKISLAVDGKVDATNAGDMLTQRLLAHVPLLLHPNPREACVIGYGSGVTAGSALTHDIERLDAVEISPGVVEASRIFERDNHKALEDDRLELHVTDGRNHLLLTDRRYDVIISEPSNPWMSGVSQLFTRDFFELARTRLGPGGLFCQWAHIYNMVPEDLKTIVAGFTDAFPQSALFLINEGDVLLVGAESELPDIESAALAQRIEERAVAEDLATVEVRNLFTFASLYALGTPELAVWAAEATRHTDNHPLLEFRAPRFMHADTGLMNRNSILEAASTAVQPDAIRRHLSEPAAEDVSSRARMLEQAESFQWAFETYLAAARIAPDQLEAHEGIVRTAIAIEQPQTAEDTLRTFSPTSGEPFSIAASIGLGLLYHNLGRYEEALQELDRALRADRQNFRALLLAAEVEGEIARTDMMENLARMVLELEHNHPEAGALLAEAAMRREEFELALSRALYVLEQHPEQTRALQVAAISYVQMAKIEESRSRFRQLIELEPDGWLHYNNFARLEMASNNFSTAAELYEKAVDLNPRNVEGYVGLRDAARIAGDSGRLERAESMLKVLGVHLNN
jgi:predicted membrane-bound spermidine synthase/tetratricopeptide (TPR) repeat protein